MRGRELDKIRRLSLMGGFVLALLVAAMVATFALNKVNNYNFNGDSTGWVAVNNGSGIDGCGLTTLNNQTAFATFAYSANAFQAISSATNNTRHKGFIHQQVTIPGAGNTSVRGSFYYTGTSTGWRASNVDGFIRLDLFNAANTTLVANLACQQLPGSNVAGATVTGALTSVAAGTYTLRATLAYRNQGSTTATLTIDNIMVNSAPTGLAGTPVASSTNASLSWSASTTVSGPNLRGTNPYQVYRGTTSGGEVALAFATTNSYTDSTATGNTTYYYQLTDFDVGLDNIGSTGDDTESPLSMEVSVLTCPGGPGGPTFSGVTDTSITVNWTAPAGGSPNYRVERAPDISGAPGAWAEVATGVASTSWTDNTVVCATTYWYRVRGYNASGNGAYSGQASQATAACPVATTTLANGAPTPPSSTLCPGGALTDLNSFTFQTNFGTNQVSDVTVTLSPAGAFNNVGTLSITNDDGTTTYGSVANPPNNTPVITLSTNTLTASTTLAQYHIRLQPKSHAAMPAVPGASYATQGIISAYSCTNAKAGSNSVASSGTLATDNLSPGNVTGLGGTAGDSQVDLSWTEPADADRSQYVVLRSATTPVAGTPTEGTTYSVGNTIGGSTVVGVIASPATAFNDTTAVNGNTYYYRVFVKDSCGNYSQTGLEAGPFTPLAKTTTVGNGLTAEPTASTLCPGDAITDLDNFTLKTSSGTDTVTSVTVSFAPAGASANIGRVSITSDDGATVYGFVDSPADSPAVALTSNINVTTTETQYHIRITPRTHAAMPAVPGASYATTGTVTAIACTNTKVYSDSGSGTKTVDNGSPSNATWGAVTPGNGQVVLNWTNPGDADFSQVVILRNSAAIADVPVEGTTYSVPGTIGTSDIIYVGPLQTWTDSTVVNGNTYYYKIFSKDSCVNYSAGAQTGPHTPQSTTTTVGNGLTAEPTASTLCPGDAIADLDNFTLKTSSGTDTVTSVTVSFAPAGASANIGRVSITSDDGVTVYGFVDSPADSQAVALTSNINVTTTETQYHIRITPRTHAAMPAVPGASYATTGTVTAIACTNTKVYSDSGSGTKTVDNGSPSNATWGAVTPGNGQVVLNWSNPGDADFSQVVILRNSAAIADVAVEGTTYSVPGTIGTSDIIYVGPLQTWTDSTVVNGNTYYYKIFSKDSCGNYSAGAQTGPHMPVGPLTVTINATCKDASDPGQWTWTGSELGDASDATFAVSTAQTQILRACFEESASYNCKQIDNVRLYVRASQTTGNEEIDFGLRGGATDYYTGTRRVPPGSSAWADYYQDYATRPWGGAWTYSDVDALIGVVQSYRTNPWAGQLQVAKMWAVITYDSSVPTCGTTTVGNGLTAEPAASTLCPGDAIADLDNFTLKTSLGTDTVSSITVSFAPAGCSANIGRVSITSDDGATVYGFVDSPADTQAVALTSNINVTATETQYHIRITPRTHAAMPAVPGASYATTGTVTAITCSNPKVYSDSGSGTKTVDNLSPSNATWGAVTPGNNQVALNWNNPGGDFSQVVILRNTSAISDVPVEGQTYSVPGTIGTSIVIYVGSGIFFNDTSALNGTAYYYKIFAKDTCGNYASGAQTGPHTPVVPGTNQVSPGAASAVVNNCNQITVSCPYADDANGNSLTTIRRGTALAGPFTTVVCNSLSGSSPRVCVDSSAVAATTYYYQVDFSDTDGVNGTDPQVIGPYTTPSCTAVGTTIGGSSAAVSSCRQISVTMPFTGDADLDGSCKVEYNTSNTWPGTTACATVTGASPRICQITGLNPSTQYWVRVTWTDPDGVTGTNPENAIGPFLTSACGGDQTAPLVMIQSPAASAIIGGSDRPKVQVYDATGLAGLTVQWKVDSGALAAATLNPNYSCGANCGIYEFTLDTVALALSNGQHSLLVQATDAAGNIGSDQIPIQVKNLGGEAAGSGYLLRRTHGSELCIDCHNLATHSSQETGSKYGTWGMNCLDCHTAHKTTNVYLVKQTVRTPNSGNKTVDFRISDKTGGTNPQYSHIGAFDAGGSPYDDGICEVCHTKVSHYRNDNSGGDHTHNAGARCLGCHKHSEGFKGAGCNGCHKAPPTVGKHGAHDEVWDSTEGNTATSYTDTASHGTATQYGFACAKCHTGTHVNDSHAGTAVDPYRVEVAFDTTTNPANPGAAYAQVYPGSSDQGVDTTKYWSWTSTVAGTDGRCSNLYCHSNAAPVGGGTNSYATVQWNQAAALVCTSCHATTGATAAGQTTLSMKHASHVNGGAGNYTFTCDECHADTIQDNSSSVVSDKRLHVNGAKDWKFSSSATAGAVNQSAGTYDIAGAKTCSATYCHSQGRATTAPFGGAPNTALAWTTGTATCESCHNGNAGVTNKMATYAHAAHMNQNSYLGTNIMCFKCHQDTVSGSSDTTINTASFHVNGSRDVKMSDGGSYAAWGCTSSYCHSSGQAVAAPIQYYNPPAWNSGTAMANDCKGCHGRHADNAFVSVAGEPNYNNGGAGNVKANSHGKHVNAAIDCANCHNDTSTTGTTIVSGSLKHIDQVRDVAIAAAWDTNAGTKYDNYNSGTKTCSSIKCHGAGTPQWGGAVYCINCHGGASDIDNWNISDDTASIISTNEWSYSGHGKPTGSNYDVTNNPPANFTGVTNACLYCHDDAVPHSVGTNPFRLRSSAITNQVCLNCHATGSAGVTVDAVLRNASAATKINAYHYGSKHGAGNNSGKFCWDCHEPHGDRSSTPSGNISMVRANVTTQSDGTYGIPSTSSAVTFTARTTGSDFAKTAAPFNGICNVCHTTALHYRNNSGDGHMGGSGCTASCHRHDQSPNLAFAEKTACNSCHNAPPPATAGRHLKHYEIATVPTSYTNLTAGTTATQYGYACAKCHTGTHVNDSTHAGTAASPYQAQVVFDNTVAPMNGGGTYSQLYNDAVDPGADTIQNYSWTNDVSPSASGKCTNIYCHSNAAPLGGTDNRASVSAYWNQTTGTVTCTSCHNTAGRSDTAVATDLSNAHGKHIQSTSGETGSYSYECDECHASIIRDNPNSPWALAAADITDKRNHVTGTHSVTFSSTLLATTINQSGGTYNQGPAYTCASTYCHSNGQSKTAPFGSATSIAWNATAALDCSSCHGGNASAAVKMGPSNDHAAHMDQVAYLGTNFQCARCHNATVSVGNDRAITTISNHVNGVSDVSMVDGGTYSGSVTKQCSTAYCHSDGTETPGNYTTMDWDLGTNLTNDCKQCHGKAGGAFVSTYGEPNYTERVTTSDDVRNSHSKHVSTTLATAKTQCVDCHSAAIDATGALTAGGAHLNKLVEITTGGKIGSYTAAGETCTNITCHGGNSASWGGPALICTNCHGGAADVLNWDPNDDVISKINTGAEWTTYGHGSAAVGFAGANICLYCHDDTISHATATNPFRLRGAANASGVTGAYNATSATNGNDICINCHDFEAGTRYGVDPDGAAGGYALKKAATSFVDAWHAGGKHAASDGGKRCWDCHDPHGDLTNIFMIGADTLRASADNYGLTGTRSTNNAIFTSGAAGGYTKATTPYTGICQVCHTGTSYWLADGTVQTHNSGTDCTLSCHIHQQPPNFAFKGAGSCKDCHSSQTGSIPRDRIIGGTAGSEGDDFIRPSRHVSNGTLTSIVTDYDCILCHAEGDLSSSGTNIKALASAHGGDGGTNTVDLRNVDSVGGTGIAVAWPGKRNAVFTATTANRDGMDSFCMNCHDSNGASTVAVNDTNPANGMLYSGTTLPTATQAQKPFNINDTLANARDSATINALRTRVLNVKSQFNSGNLDGKNFASHHNLRQFTKRYLTVNANWPATAWTAYVTKEGQTLNAAGVRETAGLHCSDCHLNEINAHGTRNTWYMLANSSFDDLTADVKFTGTGLPGGTDNCFRCHNSNAYGQAGTISSTASRTDAHDGDCPRIEGADVQSNGGAYIGYDNSGGTLHQITCLMCHGGQGFGNLHGMNFTYKAGRGTVDSKTYRFQGGGGTWRWYSPINRPPATAAEAETMWEGGATQTYGCYTVDTPEADAYGACIQHPGDVGAGGKSGTTNYARPLTY